MLRIRRVAFAFLFFFGSIFGIAPESQAASTAPSATCVSTTCTVDFVYTGDYYTWTAPASTTFTLEAWGAQGGNANASGSVITYGGKGGYAKGNISLTANQTIYIYVGGQGAGETSTAVTTVQPGGFNGGGAGYNGDQTADRRGAGGGGATDIRVLGNALGNRVIVGGGGAGGAYFSSYSTNFPGVGGGLTGGDGYTTNYAVTYSYHGKGATQSAGGAGGGNGGTAGTGTSGVGGAGVTHAYGSAGGGGGYWGGGGGGTGMGAGGGSGYVGGVTTTTLTAGNASMPNPTGGTMTGRTGNGFARITYTWGNATISLAMVGNATNVIKGQVIGIVATVDFAGKVTFYADNKRIANCISMQASIGTVTCNWKPTVQKVVTLSATIVPSGGASQGFSSALTVRSTNRINNR